MWCSSCRGAAAAGATLRTSGGRWLAQRNSCRTAVTAQHLDSVQTGTRIGFLLYLPQTSVGDPCQLGTDPVPRNHVYPNPAPDPPSKSQPKTIFSRKFFCLVLFEDTVTSFF
jgi:hypothetical protein